MIKSKLLKSVLIGMCIMLVQTGTAFASEAKSGTAEAQTVSAEIQEDALEAQGGAADSKGVGSEVLMDVADDVKREVTVEDDPDQIMTTTVEPDKAVQDLDPALVEKQAEIDQYVFQDHGQELMDRGISITHTAVMDQYVEIGMLPYTEEHIEYLYNLFGKDQVKIVEGIEAVTTIADGDMSVTNADIDPVAQEDAAALADKASELVTMDIAETEEKQIPILPISIAVIVGAAIILGAVVMIKGKGKK